MSKQANYKLIGAFVIGAVALLVASVVLLGGGALFQDNISCVMFFNESVKGLAVGAPVSYRGVTVGTVKSISLLVERKNDILYIPVQIEFPKGRADTVGHHIEGGYTHLQRVDFFKNAIKRGMRGQLSVDSIVTGQLYIQLDYFPDAPAVLVGLEGAELEIPTVPSGLQQLMGRIKQIPIDEIAGRLSEVLENANKLISSPEAASSIKSLDELLKDTNTLIDNVNKEVTPLSSQVQRNLTSVSSEANQTLQQTRLAVASFQSLVAKDSPLYYRLSTALDEINAAARSLRVFADYMERHPEAFIRGKNDRGDR